MIEENKLPIGWIQAKLEDICTVIMGQSPPSSEYNDNGNGLPFFQGKAEFTDLFPQVRKWCSAPTKIAEKNDILLSIRAPVGPTNLAPYLCSIGRGLAAIRPEGDIEVRYILYALRTYNYNLTKLATGSTFEAVSGNDVRAFEIPLAPLPEQRRIVTAIEQQFTRLDAAVTALQHAKTKLKRYRAAVLKAAVEGNLTEAWRAEHPSTEPASALLERILVERRAKWEADLRAKGKDPGKVKYVESAMPDVENLPELPEGWCWVTIEQIITYLRNGLSQMPNTSPPGYRILRINAVRPMNVDLDEVRYLQLSEQQVKGYLLDDGDILFTRYNGSLELLGVAGVVRGCSVPTLHPDKLIRVKAALAEPFITFLALASNVGISRTHMESKARTTAGQKGISGTDIKQMPIPLPPLLEQQQIVAEVERRLSIVTQLEITVEVNLKRAERLRQSILKEAFAGRLVPQDPHEEPASVLLEYIHKEREGQKQGPIKKPRELKTLSVPRMPDGEPIDIDTSEMEQMDLWMSIGSRE